MFASLTRIDAPPGKEPTKTSAPSLPVKFCIEMDTLGMVSPAALKLLLSNRRTAPLSNETFFIDTVRFAAAGLAWTIAATLMLIVMFPCATTFTNATLVQDVLIVSFASGTVELITTHGITAIAGCSARSMMSVIATSIFMCPLNGRRMTSALVHVT